MHEECSVRRGDKVERSVDKDEIPGREVQMARKELRSVQYSPTPQGSPI